MFDFQPTVLIIEDDANIRRFVRQALESEGCAVFEADTVKRGLIEAGTRQPDAVVLDLGLPDEDGMTLIRELRGWTEVPVLVLSARTAEADKVAALDAGADDYLTKPFALLEVEARLLALIQRAKGAIVDTVRVFGDLSYDTRSRGVSIGGKPVHLTRKATLILEALLRDPGRVVSREELEALLWGSEPPSSDALRSQVHLLRRALADAGFDGIETMHGTGWRLVQTGGAA